MFIADKKLLVVELLKKGLHVTFFSLFSEKDDPPVKTTMVQNLSRPTNQTTAKNRPPGESKGTDIRMYTAYYFGEGVSLTREAYTIILS